MSTPFKYSGERKSHQSFNEVYFWTSVIKDWKHLLTNDVMKMIVIQSFQWLVQHELVYIYGYVPIAIGMPNHIHVLWEQLKMNGKESIWINYDPGMSGEDTCQEEKAQLITLAG